MRRVVYRTLLATTCLGIVGWVGCTSASRSDIRPTADASRSERTLGADRTEVLAGRWEYEEAGLTITLVLDRHGDGPYDYKGGRFMTTELAHGLWRGRWVQTNDREGEFEIALTPDAMEGEGRWWYTRIDTDVHPTKAGGRFRVTKDMMPSEAGM
jgi:hypothetical protein